MSIRDKYMENSRKNKPLQMDYDGNGLSTKLDRVMSYADIMGEVMRENQKYGDYYKQLASQDRTPDYHYGALEELYTKLWHQWKNRGKK